ncbi:MAG: hypothetical protein GFH27_549303n62 [Chloroflexi bacterium AL-W]|nr:hypothetical protein [Chloroflexi bacterium AL-N1]NOK67947.1 hypothetical protein [Chloroflexi bacterium AL-N10]NOK73287.1 hypothetical protein [Chloroflexi bacterium AL-N5]NOK83201.1 hypothetical protein [Chloroflexi bacterium AL-W]NOK87618.1 hypothetical protein [Chloroflexi bacterium AL-N15]
MVFLPGLGITALKGPTPNDSSSLRVMTPTETANMVPLMTSSAPYRHFLAQLGTNVTPNQPFAVEHGSTLFVTLPLAVNGQSENAFFTAALQRKTEQTANILETVAVHREVVPQGKHMCIWVKTALISDTLLDNNGTILDGWMLKEGQRINIAGQNFSTQGREQSDAILQTLMANSDGSPSIASTCYDDCSSACAVPNDIAGAAALVCAAVCIGSLGAGCIACATVAAGVYAFNVGCCLVKCNGAPILPCCGS